MILGALRAPRGPGSALELDLVLRRSTNAEVVDYGRTH